MKTYFKVFVLLNCLVVTGQAQSKLNLCDDGVDNQTAITFEQAQNQLVKFLYSSDLGAPTSAYSSVALDCVFKRNRLEGSALIALRHQLDEEGDDKQQLITTLSRSLMQDRATAYVVFPMYNPDKQIRRNELNLIELLKQGGCSEQATNQCAKSLSAAKHLWLVVQNARGWANLLNADEKQASLEFNKNLKQQWQSYRQDTVKLWPQEVLLNSIVYSRTKEQGLAAPPSSKLFFLRPSLGISYLSDDEHHLQPTINIDLLGRYWWRYQDNKAGQGRGLSLSLIRSRDDTAYGVTYHHNPKWSATLATSDENDLVFSLSFQLGYALLKR